jgi:FtsP/CotA-like multicopper oxidase with cupredoxin domain
MKIIGTTLRHFKNPFAIAAVALLLVQAVPALAQAGSGRGRGTGPGTATAAQTGKQIPCPAQQELLKNPELVSSNGRLRATLVVGSQLQRMAFRYPLTDPTTNKPTQPGAPSAFMACYEQWVRSFSSPDAVPPYPGPKTGVNYVDPMAGPTLRATLGDVIELAFLNVINPSNFGDSIDRGDKQGCDESFGGGSKIYPGADQYPNCFHGSTTANLHFHGTHTNPNTTGDNVFLEIVSYMRLKDEPVPTAGSFRATLFDAFFNQCEARLLKGQHVEYPTSWNDLPALWTTEQKRLLKKYDELPGMGKKLWPVDERQLLQGAWPQYYFGSYPYCFRIPEFKEPPASGSESAARELTVTPHVHGEGTAELGATTDFDEGATTPALIMGQAPGTHWYHAHKHGSTAIDVSNGMTGAFIIEGDYDQEISQYYDPTAKQPGVAWTRKQPVMVINQIGVSPNLFLGGAGQDKGPDFSVNGRLNPLLTMQPGEVKMWRIVNSSSRAGVYFIGPPAGFHWKQIAQDGVQFNNANWTDPANMDQPFLLAAGNRADLLVLAPPAACTVTGGCRTPVQVHNIVDPTDLTTTPPPNKISLLTLNVTGKPISPPMEIMPTAPAFPSFLADIDAREVIGTKKIEFSSTPPFQAVHKIDGHQFNGEIGKVVLLNTVEEWKVSNATANPNIAHPFHIHINPFQVTEEFDPKVKLPDGSPKYVTSGKDNLKQGQCYLDPLAENPDDWKSCDPPKPTPKNLIWWDVFPIPSGLAATDADGNPITKNGQPVIIPGYFKMRSRFVDFAGYYVIHCHILAHEDRGMMTVVEVAPIRSPYSHH